MHLRDDGLLAIDARDVSDYLRCPWAWLQQVDVDLSGGYPVPPVEQPIRQLMAETATRHRARVERYLSERYPGVRQPPEGVDSIEVSTPPLEATTLRATWSWLDEVGVAVSTQADALVPSANGTLRIVASRLGHSSIQAAELAAAGGVLGLRSLGFAVDELVDVFYADGESETRRLDDDVALWQETMKRLSADYRAWRDGLVSLDWWDTPLDQCGRLGCAWCQDALSRYDDVFHTARLRRSHRRSLRAHGIFTMTELTELSPQELVDRVPDVEPEALITVHRQASVQRASAKNPASGLAVEVVDETRLAALAEPSPGDVYLDFEGDPSYTEWPENSSFEPGHSGRESWLGIDYLIGLLESDSDTYRSWWSDSFAEEAVQFDQFVRYVERRRHTFPEMRVYHYAGYEVAALRRLATRHRIHHDVVERWIDQEVLVDLYREVMASVAIGSPSYSLKKLEALYFTGDERQGIAGGAESVLAFSDYRQASPADKPQLRQAILDYNQVDCFSTKALHRWLVELRRKPY